MSNRRGMAALVVTTVLLGACGTDSSETTLTDSVSTTSTVADTVTTDTPTVADLAIDDLTARLDVDRDSVSVMKAEPKTWSDGSLGCPEPGMSYTQALVDGWQVLLQVGERIFDYHAGADGIPFLCASPDKDGGYDFVPPPGIND